MSMNLERTLDDLAVYRMSYVILDGDRDGLVHLIADNDPDAGFSEVSFFHDSASHTLMRSSRSYH